ncbi:hypothetical protein THAOC_03704 [Thalassiosira oceanica]|uniref:J domain-containing protein n=1 Tax=Thalassiosira oceanica TaxID=159749 RepID=K0TPN0_THAOC|nr:hypothetical protein THAOC_03704 [Thalassiosira oceanica]|eukprot:EJK74607.1 hypothetical protein THAOC_03704 [Thalassiosira oceanica]
MTQVKDDHIKREDTLKMFYGIPNIRTTIAVRQLSFIGKAVRNDTPNLPTRLMIKACCKHRQSSGLQDGLNHTTKTLLSATYNQTGEGGIATTEGNCQSNSSSQRREQSGPRQGRAGRRPPPRASREEEPTSRQNDPEGVGRNLFDSFGVLGLGLDATEMDVKTVYRMLALQYHPDKNDPERTGMTRDQATAHFQLLNTANSYLRSVLTFSNRIPMVASLSSMFQHFHPLLIVLSGVLFDCAPPMPAWTEIQASMRASRAEDASKEWLSKGVRFKSSEEVLVRDELQQ